MRHQFSRLHILLKWNLKQLHIDSCRFGEGLANKNLLLPLVPALHHASMTGQRQSCALFLAPGFALKTDRSLLVWLGIIVALWVSWQ